MMSFLKSFLANDRSEADKALQTRMAAERERDVLRVDGYEEPAQSGGCGPKKGGCGNCGCG